MLEFEYFKCKETERNAKLTVHKNGKAGFSEAANKLMNLDEWEWCAFARDKKRNRRQIYIYRKNDRTK